MTIDRDFLFKNFIHGIHGSFSQNDWFPLNTQYTMGQEKNCILVHKDIYVHINIYIENKKVN